MGETWCGEMRWDLEVRQSCGWDWEFFCWNGCISWYFLIPQSPMTKISPPVQDFLQANLSCVMTRWIPMTRVVIFPKTQAKKAWWFFLLLVEEILHQVIGSLSNYLQSFIHPRWCRISEPSTVWPQWSLDLDLVVVFAAPGSMFGATLDPIP